jgi:hypothetical protein
MTSITKGVIAILTVDSRKVITAANAGRVFSRAAKLQGDWRFRDGCK